MHVRCDGDTFVSSSHCLIMFIAVQWLVQWWSLSQFAFPYFPRPGDPSQACSTSRGSPRLPGRPLRPAAPPSRPAPARRGGRWNLSRRRRRRRGPPRRAPKANPGAAVAAICSVAWPPTPTGKSGRSPGRGSSPTRQARSGEGGGSQVMREQMRQMPVNELECHSNMCHSNIYTWRSHVYTWHFEWEWNELSPVVKTFSPWSFRSRRSSRLAALAGGGSGSGGGSGGVLTPFSGPSSHHHCQNQPDPDHPPDVPGGYQQPHADAKLRVHHRGASAEGGGRLRGVCRATAICE